MKALNGRLRSREDGLAGFLANEKAVAPLLKFLKATGIGGGGKRRSKGERNWNGSGKVTKQVKICVDRLRRG